MFIKDITNSLIYIILVSLWIDVVIVEELVITCPHILTCLIIRAELRVLLINQFVSTFKLNVLHWFSFPERRTGVWGARHIGLLSWVKWISFFSLIALFLTCHAEFVILHILEHVVPLLVTWISNGVLSSHFIFRILLNLTQGLLKALKNLFLRFYWENGILTIESWL